MSTGQSTKLGGVVGDPVDHSLSPQIHGHWLRLYGIKGAYVPLRVTKESFSVALAGLRAVGFAGINVTVPHKEAAFAVACTHDAVARASGAANLLIFGPDGMEARNTDAAGLAASLSESLGPDWLKGKPAVLLGAGGAARAGVLGLDILGAAEIRVLARNHGRARFLTDGLQPATGARLRAFDWNEWQKAASGVSLVVNATSAGMAGNEPLALPFDPLPKDAAICDIVYNPLETPFLKAARARGHVTVDGLGMLMHQAAPAFAAFYGILPQVTPVLRAELEEALRGES